MSGDRNTGRGGLAIFAALALTAGLALPGASFAAENEIRMPVQKTARLAPLGEVEGADTAPVKPADKAKDAKKAQDKTPKTAMGKAVEAAAAAEAEREAKSVKADKAAASTKKAAHATPHTAKHEDPGLVVPTGAPIPVPGAVADPAPPAAQPVQATPEAVPAPGSKPVGSKPAAAKPVAKATAEKKTPPPAPAPVVDPKASLMPKAPERPQASAAPLALPAEGQWAGEMRVDFEEERVIVHTATNRAPERVTWFNQQSPRKLAIDLRGPWKKKGAHVLRFDTGPVKNIVVGEHEDRLRIAVEFRDGAVAPTFEPAVQNAAEGVTVSIPLAVRLHN